MTSEGNQNYSVGVCQKRTFSIFQEESFLFRMCRLHFFVSFGSLVEVDTLASS